MTARTRPIAHSGSRSPRLDHCSPCTQPQARWRSGAVRGPARAMPQLLAALLVGLVPWMAQQSAWSETSPSDAAVRVQAATVEHPSAAVLAARAAFTEAHPRTATTTRQLGITRIFGQAFSGGATPQDSADAFVQIHSAIFGVAPRHLAPVGPFPSGEHELPLVYDPSTNTSKFTLVCYTQRCGGIPVFRSDLRVLVRNEPGFPAVLATSSLRDLGAFGEALDAGATPAPALNAAFLLAAVSDRFPTPPTLSDMRTVVWAGTDNSIEAPHLAHQCVATSGSPWDRDSYQRRLYVVDAHTGAILHEESLIRDADADGQVLGMATDGVTADLCAPEIPMPLPYASILFGGEVWYADANGLFTAANVPGGATSGVSTIGGLYFSVIDQAGPLSTVSAPVGTGMTLLHNAANTSALFRAQVNAYIRANEIRDLVLEQAPAYPVLSAQSGQDAFKIRVNLAGGCNAFYDGTAINFSIAGSGCANMAFGSVVHHEYGHHLVECAGSGQGPYGEGTGDCMGILVSDQSVIGVGYANACGSGARDANNTCQYNATSCSSCGYEIHTCGTVLSGCVWDLRTLWRARYPADYLAMLRSIVINAIPLHGPTSTIEADIAIDYLTLDDDNADITDGTPNSTDIVSAFGAHGLDPEVSQAVQFTYPEGVSAQVMPNGTTALRVNVSPLATQPQAGTGVLQWRTGTTGPFTAVPMTEVAPNSYMVHLPASACLTTMQFYVQVQTAMGVEARDPADAPASFHTAVSAGSMSIPFQDDMETANAGWTVGAPGDTATAGIWTRVAPVWNLAQPWDDHTDAPGTHCWVTGQSVIGTLVGSDDVDGGVTTLISPTFDATGFDAVEVSYWRWFSNDQGANPNTDTMPVQVSNNNGASWVTLESASTNAHAWTFKSFRISDIIAPTATMKLRWLARDTGSPSIVEAAVDDVVVRGFVCAAPLQGDLDGDGHVDGTDLGLLLGAWGSAGPFGDLDGSGSVDGTDLGVLLGAWTS